MPPAYSLGEGGCLIGFDRNQVRYAATQIVLAGALSLLTCLFAGIGLVESGGRAGTVVFSVVASVLIGRLLFNPPVVIAFLPITIGAATIVGLPVAWWIAALIPITAFVGTYWILPRSITDALSEKMGREADEMSKGRGSDPPAP